LPTRVFEPRWSKKTVPAPDKPNWVSRLQRTWLGMSIIAIVGFVAGAAAVQKQTTDLLVFLGVQTSDAMAIAQNDARSKFTQDLTKEAWGRVFRARRYLLTVRYSFPPEEQEEAWKQYLEATASWNVNLMLNIMMLNYHYGNSRSGYFEHTIQPRFGKIHYCLEIIRHPKNTGILCELASGLNPERLERWIDKLNANLYCFVTGLPLEDDSSCMFQSKKPWWRRF
jgi:hypothetical protein